MRRRRVWFRRLTTAIATAAIGSLFGFLIPTIVDDLTPRPPAVVARVSESPVAREFINAFVGNDQPTLERLRLADDMKLRAARYSTEFQRVDPPVHLGSFVGPGYTLHGYAATVVNKDGTPGMLSWRVITVADGRILYLTPPSGIEQP